RRHTRSKRDWSSDVCSSDLGCPASATPPAWPSTTEPAEYSWPATPHTSTHPPEDKASTSASRTHSTSAGNWPPPSTAGHPQDSWTATTPNDAPWPPTCSTTPAHKCNCCPPTPEAKQYAAWWTNSWTSTTSTAT